MESRPTYPCFLVSSDEVISYILTQISDEIASATEPPRNDTFILVSLRGATLFFSV